MHCCVYLFTKDLPNDEQIHEIMYPYSDYATDKEYTGIDHDSWTVGGRYGGMLKLQCSEESETYKWYFYVDAPRAGRVFRCPFLEKLLRVNKVYGIDVSGFYSFNDIENDYFLHSGIQDGYIYVDGCKISDLHNIEELTDHGYGFVDDAFGKYSTRDFWDKEKCSFIDNSEYENELKAAFERNKDNYITVLDLHS